MIAKVTTANVVPHSLAPNIDQEQLKGNPEQKGLGTNNRVEIPPLTPEKEKLFFNKIDLSGTNSLDLSTSNKLESYLRITHIYLLWRVWTWATLQ